METPVEVKRRKDRPKKRKFQGNQHTASTSKKAATDTSRKDLDLDTSSSRKLKETVSKHSIAEELEPEGYRFAHVPSIVSYVASLPCKFCFSSKRKGRSSVCEPSYTVNEKRKGLTSIFSFTCNLCEEKLPDLDLSPTENLNLRFQYSMYSIGIHSEKSNRFLANMNMPKSVAPSRMSDYKKKIHAAVSSVASNSMNSAAEEIKEGPTQNVSEAAVSCDGTWQKRGFVSKNGIATVLSVHETKPAKVVDVEVLSNYCDSCAKAKARMSEEEFAEFGTKHECQKNHFSTAGSMEPAGMMNIFKRSVDKHGLQYTQYLGDGDSKSYRQVADADIYEGKSIEKLECCGHVQKRMGKRLIDKVAQCKGKKYVEKGKQFTGIGGAGRLTSKAIKRIQGHYGGAIRKNVGDIEAMRKSIWAIWKHRGGNHDDCGEWCKKGEKNILPQFVLKEIEPVFKDLSRDELLQKCLHGGTQNNNESYHNLIWNRCPKSVFVGRERLEIAALDAAIVYNNGELGRIDVFQILGLEVGKFLIDGLRHFDTRRIKSSADRKDTAKKEQRKFKQHAQENKPDDTYGAGAHD